MKYNRKIICKFHTAFERFTSGVVANVFLIIIIIKCSIINFKNKVNCNNDGDLWKDEPHSTCKAKQSLRKPLLVKISEPAE